MKYRNKKTLLFIEPCLSSYPLILKAKEKGYTTLVLSTPFDQWALPEEVLNASSSFFQLNTSDHEAVLDLVHKISRKFQIDGVVPGAQQSIPLTGKIAAFLNKPGLTQEAALFAHQKDLLRNILTAQGIPLPSYWRVETKEELQKNLSRLHLPCVLKPLAGKSSISAKTAHSLKDVLEVFESLTTHKEREPQKGVIIEEYIAGKEYSLEGFVKNKAVHIVSLTEKLLPSKEELGEIGYIVCSKTDPPLFDLLSSYIKSIFAALPLKDSPFQANIRLSVKGPLLIGLSLWLPEEPIPRLIHYATGIDYEDNLFKLFSREPLSLHKTKNSTAGILFFYPYQKNETPLNPFLETLLEHPFVREIKVYHEEEKRYSFFPLRNHKLGHVILVHEDYHALTHHMEDIRTLVNPLLRIEK